MARVRGQGATRPPLPAAAAPTERKCPRPADGSAPPAPDEPGASAPPGVLVEVRRSPRRRRTVSAYRDGDTIVVLLPQGLDTAQEARWVRTMLNRLDGQEQRRRPDDMALAARAGELSRRYFRGRAIPTTVRWVDNQGTRWGSCTPSDGSIRISDRLRGVPTWVLDYVVLHELAHLLEPGHGSAFWQLLEAYPRTERARGFLEGLEHVRGRGRVPGEGSDVLPGTSE